MKHTTNFNLTLLKGLSFLHLIFLLGYSNGLFAQQMHAFVTDVEIRDFEFEGGKVWAITENSLVCYDTISGQKTFYNYSNCGLGIGIDQIKIDDLGNKLMLDAQGLHVLSAANVWTHYSQIGGNDVNNYYRLNKDRQGRIWVIPIASQTMLTKFFIWENQTFAIHNNWSTNMPTKLVDFDEIGNMYYSPSGNQLCKVDTLFNLTVTGGAGIGLPNSTIVDLAVKADGAIWITYSNGTNFSKILPTGTATNFQYSNFGINFTGNGDVRIYRDRNDSLYFFKNSQSGVYRKDDSVYTNVGNLPVNNVLVTSINISETNTVYWGCKSYNSCFFKQSNGNVTAIDMANCDVSSNSFKAPVVDYSGNKWFLPSFMGGILKFDGNTWTSYNVLNSAMISNDVSSFCVTNDNILWFTSSTNLVGKLENGVISYVQNFTFLLETNTTIITDKFNNIWVRGKEGLYKFDGVSWVYFFASNSTNFNNNSTVISIASDTLGNIWGSTSGLGLFKFGLNNQYTFFTNASIYSGDPIYNVFCDKYNKIYFNTWDANNYISRVFDGNTFADYTVNGHTMLYRLQESDTTELHITTNGLYRVQGANATQLLPYQKFNTTQGFAIDNSNNIWVTYFGSMGILCYNSSGFGQFPFQGNPQNSLSGKVYYDYNQNGIEDSNDFGLPWKGVKNNTNNTFAYTNGTGNYTQYLPDGAYTIQENFQAQSNYILTSDSATFHVNLNQSNASNLNFGAFTDANQDSVVVNFSPGLVRCNTTVNNWITITNYSVFPFSGDVNLQFDDSVTFSFNNIQGILNGNTATWHIDSLAPFQSLTISFITANPTVSFIINNPTGTIDYALSVTNPNVLYSSVHSYNLLCSYDPNFKEVNPAGVGFQNHTLQNTPLEYTLHFQNMGNDTAFHVLVTDTLSSILNPETFEYIAASHTVNITRIGNILKFDFPQINLLPKSMNEPLSQGFVKFRIKTFENLPDYTLLQNTANIYFDFNPPVITNTSLNTLVYELDVNVDELSNLNNQVLIYPNPADNILTIDLQSISIENCIILNTLGQKVYNSANEINANHKIQLNISNLSAGVYFVKVRSSNGSYTAKFIKSE